MPLIVGVRFRPATKMYYFGAEDLPDLSVGDYVVVDTSRGEDAGMVVQAPTEIAPEDVIGDLKPVMRRADANEVREMHRLREREQSTLDRCRELVAEYKLDMKVLRAEYNFDGSRLLFYFTAEGRVDFRDLVRALARTFKTRIDLHQVGVRDEAKLIGSLGICGRLLCCRDWLPEFNKVSIRMAKHQNLSLNPLEISGACGRLLCCLAYEDEFYSLMKGVLPKRGQTVQVEEGAGVVADVNVVTEKVTVRLEDDRLVHVDASAVQYDANAPEPKLPRRR